VFLGAHGVDLRAGLTTPNLVESETNRALVSSARRTCVLVDSSKFGVVGLSSFLDLAEVDELITDGELSPHTRKAFAEAVTDLVVAGRSRRRIPREETA
jgi:DeoR/GlpR family transcriptional regulator of sugar metabolism